MTIIERVRSILTDDNENFQHLLEQSQLDPRLDLQGCDFSGIDFGALTTDVLNSSLRRRTFPRSMSGSF